MHFIKNATIMATALIITTSVVHAEQPQTNTPQPENTVKVAGQADKTAVTIINEEASLVRESYPVDLVEGINHIRFNDISPLIALQTVTIDNDSSIHLLEQDYQFDPLTPQNFERAYKGYDVTIISHDLQGKPVKETARILALDETSPASSIILQYKDRIEKGLPEGAKIQYGALPESAYRQASLVTTIDSDANGGKNVDLTYLTGGLSWKSDYSALLAADGKTLTLINWITLTNKSGKDYRQAKFRLMQQDANVDRDTTTVAKTKADSGYLSKSFSLKDVVYENIAHTHLYELMRPIDLSNGTTKRVALFNASDVPVQQSYLVSGNPYSEWTDDIKPDRPIKRAITTQITFKNDTASKLGLTLPNGDISFSIRDSNNAPILIGKNQINRTTAQNEIRLNFDSAYDLDASWRLIKSEQLSRAITQKQIEVSLTNDRNTEATITLVENIKEDWKISAETTQHIRYNPSQIGWTVTLPPHSRQNINYTVDVKE